MKERIKLIPLISILLVAGCSPNISKMENDFLEEIEAAFQNQSIERLIALHKFKDEPEELISQLKERWRNDIEREIDSISFEAIPDAMQNSYSAGYEIDGKWYKPFPSPYKSVLIKYKNKEEASDGSRWAVATRKLVSVDGNKIVFPGMKLTDEAPKEVRIVLPDMFTGKFSVVWLEDGATAKETEDSLTYEIPESGELAVKSLKHFMQGRPMVIEYKSGYVIYGERSDKTEANRVYFDPNSMSMRAGSIGAPAGTSSSEYFGTKLSWKIKKSEHGGDTNSEATPLSDQN